MINGELCFRLHIIIMEKFFDWGKKSYLDCYYDTKVRSQSCLHLKQMFYLMEQTVKYFMNGHLHYAFIIIVTFISLIFKKKIK